MTDKALKDKAKEFDAIASNAFETIGKIVDSLEDAMYSNKNSADNKPLVMLSMVLFVLKFKSLGERVNRLQEKFVKLIESETDDNK